MSTAKTGGRAYYLHLDNGDWNMKSETLHELLGDIDFEIRCGGAKKLMVTSEPVNEHPLFKPEESKDER